MLRNPKNHFSLTPAPLRRAGSARSKLLNQSPRRSLLAWVIVLGAPLFFASGAQADIVYVSSSGNNRVLKFSADGTGTIFIGSGLNCPSGLAFDSVGNLYVANIATPLTAEALLKK